MRADTIINSLLALAFDAFFNWYYPLKDSIPFMCEMDLREARALDNMQSAIDMHEIVERVAIGNHGSYMYHAAIFKITRDILTVGDIWAVDTSPLELLNAETKRVAEQSGARNIVARGAGQSRKQMRGVHEGPAQLVRTKGYDTTMALSTLRNLLATQQLRRGDGVAKIQESRRHEHLFGESGTGRMSLCRAGIKVEKLGVEYVPRYDTCVAAFVRLLAMRAVASPDEEA